MNARELAQLYAYNDFVINANTEGVSDDESLLQPSPAANCMNWILGHIVRHRNLILKYAGGEPVVPEARITRYDKGSAPMTDAGDAIAFSELLASYRQSHERLTARLAILSPERLAETAGDAKEPDKTVAQMLAGLMFHEAYHAGQLGILRRLIGKQGALV